MDEKNVAFAMQLRSMYGCHCSSVSCESTFLQFPMIQKNCNFTRQFRKRSLRFSIHPSRIRNTFPFTHDSHQAR